MTATPMTLPANRRRDNPARWARDVLRARAVAGMYTDRPLPLEHELVRQLGVSRNAVRAALELLRAEGLVRRVPGSGTFVVATKASQGLDRLRGLAESFPASAGPVVNQVLASDIVEAPPYVAERLAMTPGASVVFIERLRRLDGEPVSLDASYLDAAHAAHLLDCDLVANDVFVLLEQELGLRLAAANLSIEAIASDPVTAGILGIAPGAPLLLLERLASLEGGRPIDFEFVRYRGDRLSLTTRLTRHHPEAP